MLYHERKTLILSKEEYAAYHRIILVDKHKLSLKDSIDLYEEINPQKFNELPKELAFIDLYNKDLRLLFTVFDDLIGLQKLEIVEGEK